METLEQRLLSGGSVPMITVEDSWDESCDCVLPLQQRSVLAGDVALILGQCCFVEAID